VIYPLSTFSVIFSRGLLLAMYGWVFCCSVCFLQIYGDTQISLLPFFQHSRTIYTMTFALVSYVLEQMNAHALSRRTKDRMPFSFITLTKRRRYLHPISS
jgi:hypothetical protein